MDNPYSSCTSSLLQAIVDAQSCFIRAQSISQSFQVLLNKLLAITQSDSGIIGEVLESEDGAPYFQAHSISHLTWNVEPQHLNTHPDQNLRSTNFETVFGKVILSGQHVIDNHPDQDDPWVTIDDHPIAAFLVVPFYYGDTLVGMAGMANRPSGYDEALVEFLRPLLAVCGTLIAANRNKQTRSYAERALQESEERFELAVWGSNDGIWDWPNIQEDKEWWSPRFYDLLGYEFEEITPSLQTFKELLHPEERNRVFVAVQNHFEKDLPFDVEYRLQTKSGAYRWFRARGKSVRNQQGVITRMAGSIQDIHDQRQAERAMCESEARFRTMADTAPVLIWMSDSEKNCTYVNQRWLDFTGRTLEQELGMGWIDNVHPEDQQRCLPICEAAFQSHTPMEMEFRLKHKKEGYRWVIDRGVPRFNSDGQFLGFIGTCVDISGQKQHEQAIFRYNRWLQKEIEERTIRIHELEQRRMQVEKLAALSQVTAGIAHEINNPLASIQQSLQLVKQIIPMDHPRAKYVPKIEQEIHRMATIIKQMYQLYQPRQEFPRLLNLNQIVKDASDFIVNLHKNGHGQIHLDLFNGMYDLPLPATELRQVLCNVLQNAFDSVEVHGRVVVRTGMNAGTAWIQIQDDGAGISPDVLSHIFEPFYSTKVNMKRNGMGLGLSVSKSLLEAMGGKIQVSSTLGKGATFTISFPLPLVPTYSTPPEESVSRVS